MNTTIYHSTIKMKSSTDTDFDVENNKRISKSENIVPEDYTPNQSEEVSVIKKVKNNVPRTYVLKDLNENKIVGMFYKKELQNTNPTN